jgi:hypothetical protein
VHNSLDCLEIYEYKLQVSNMPLSNIFKAYLAFLVLTVGLVAAAPVPSPNAELARRDPGVGVVEYLVTREPQTPQPKSHERREADPEPQTPQPKSPPKN